MPRRKETPMEEKTENIEAQEEQNVIAQLSQLGAELQKVASDKTAREAKIKEIENVLGKLQVKDFPDLAESPVVQSFVKLFGDGDLRPGETKNKGTLAEVSKDWSFSDLKQFRLVKFLPHETVPLTFNGLTVLVQADQECEVPECFYNIYRERQIAMANARKNERYLMGMSDEPPDPMWQTDEAAVVRAWSKQGDYLGKKSGFLGVGPLNISNEGVDSES